MSASLVRLWLCVLGIGCLVGCGDVPNSGSATGNSGPTSVTVTFTGATPTAVAAQIGSAPYTIVTPAASVALMLPSGTTKFAVAYVCTESFPPSGAGPSIDTFQNVIEASTVDGTSFTEPCQSATTADPAFASLTGSIDGSAVPGVNNYGISQGAGFTGVNLGTPGNSFSVLEPVGPQRVLVAAYNAVSAPPAIVGSISLLAARNFDNQPVPGTLNNGSAVVLGPADETTSQTISFNSVPSGFTSPQFDHTTTAEFVMNGLGGIILADPANTKYPILPAGATEKGDFYRITTSTGNGQESMILSKTSATGVPIVFTFPATWGYAGPAPASLPALSVVYAGFSSDSSLNYNLGLRWTDSGIGYFSYISASGNYLNPSTSITYPDLSNLPGFFKSPSGATVLWNVDIARIAYDSQPASASNATTTIISDNGKYLVP